MITYVELRLYNDTASEYNILPDFTTISFDSKYNDIGAIELGYPLGKAQLMSLSDGSLLGVVCGFDDGTTIEAERYYIYGTNDEKVSDGRRIRTLSGRSTLASLEDARVYPSNWPVTSPTGHSFTEMTVGNIMRTLIARAKSRGTLALINETTFSGVQDSSGAAWLETHSQDYASGTDYLQILTDFMTRGFVDARMNGWTLELRNGGQLGAHVAQGSVEIRPAKNATEMSVTTNSAESATTVLIEGEEGTVIERHSAAAQALLKRRRERYVSQGGVRDAGVLSILGDAELELYGRIPAEETVGITPSGGLDPFKDFKPADWIWVRYDTDQDATERRVRQLAVSVDENRSVTVAATLNTILYEDDIRLQRKIDAYAGSGGSYGSVPNSGVDLTVPTPPTGLSVTSSYFIDGRGLYQGAFAANWNAPTTNVDGTSIGDLSHYEIQWQYTSDSLWSATMRTAGTETNFGYSPVSPGQSINVRVRAVDNSGHVSDWATENDIALEEDEAAPATPSAPTVTSGVEAVSVTWDGKNSTNGAMDPDLDRVELWTSPAAGFTPPTSATLVGYFAPGGGTLEVVDLPLYTTQYFKLVARDKANNASPASAQASGKLGSDGNPPAGSPTPTVTGIYLGVLIRWAAVPNRDPVTYEVHLSSASGFTPSASTLLTETISNAANTTKLPNGDALVVGQPYYVRIIAKDVDGAAAAGGQAAGAPVGVSYETLDPDIRDPFEELQNEVVTHTKLIESTQVDQQILSTRATEALGAATTADGRISISDDPPGPEDVTGRPEGSVWLTRTRARINLVTNPSFEDSTAGWAPSNTTISRVAVTDTPVDGAYGLQIVNGAASSKYSAYWNNGGGANRLAVLPGQTLAGSAVARLITAGNTTFLNEVKNLFVNPSAELDLANATATNATLARSSAWSVSGDYSFQLTNSSTANDSYLSIGGDAGALRNGMVAGQSYTVSGTINIPAALTGTKHANAQRIVAYTRIGTGAVVETASDVAPDTGSQRLSVTFTVPAGATEAYIRFYSGSGTTGEVVRWDALSLTPASTSTITTKEISSGVATLGTSATHSLVPGDEVEVTGVDDPEAGEEVFNGTYVVTAVTPTTFSYAKVSTDVLSQAATGTATRIAAYFDGDSIDTDTVAYGWTGTPHASTSRRYDPRTAQAELWFYDSAGALLDTEVGPPIALPTTDWTRLWVLAEVPPGAASVILAPSNLAHSDVWQIDGALLEISPIIGSYFDGDNYDASWMGTPNGSPSRMVGGKIFRVHELDDGEWIEKFFTGDTLTDIDATEILRGFMDGERIKDKSIPLDKMSGTPGIATENLPAGTLVNIYNLAGEFRVRKACAADGRECNGYVLEEALTGQYATVYGYGYNPFLSGLEPGTAFLSTTPGVAASAPPTTVGTFIQPVGAAASSTFLNFVPGTPIYLT